MPTRAQKRSGQYPVRLSVKLTTDASEVIDHLEKLTGHYRSVIAREALDLGLVAYHRRLKKRSRRSPDAPSSSAAPSSERAALTRAGASGVSSLARRDLS